MINVIYLAINLLICLYFIYKKDHAILGYIILFQEIHLIPFNNIGYNLAGYVYYIFISILFLLATTSLKLSKKRIKYLLTNKIIWGLGLLTLIIGIHVLLIGLQSENARILAYRYFLQILPALIYLIFVLDKADMDNFINQISKGILLYGLFLAIILITTTDALNIASYKRSEISENIGVSPIAITRTGCTMFITSFILYLEKEYDKYSVIMITLMIISISLIILGTSRGPVLSMLVAFLIYFLFRRNIFRKILPTATKLVIPIVFLILISAVFNFNNLEVFQLYTERVESLEDYESMTRYLRFQLAYDFFKNEFSIFSPFFFYGAGPAGFDLYFGLSYAHNFILEMIFEYGLVGFISVTLIIIYSIYYSYKLLRSNISEKYMFIPLLIIFQLVASMFSGDLIGRRDLFFLAIILIHIYTHSRKINI